MSFIKCIIPIPVTNMTMKYRPDPIDVKNYNAIISNRLKNVKSSLAGNEPVPLPRNQNHVIDHKADRIARDNASLVARVNS